MTIQHIYEHYDIMPSLQLHQYRVAAVAATVAESMDEKIDLPELLTATLLHDMGNILKFDLDLFPEFLEPEGRAYWANVQAEFRQKYGDDEHDAAAAIAEELHISPRSQDLLDAIGFHSMEQNIKSSDMAKKIAEYADARVAPFGLTTLAKRLSDLEMRYKKRYPSPADQARRAKFSQQSLVLEQQIFSHSSLQPSEITQDSIQPRLENLRKFEIIREA